jgi:hypothetical protein
MYMRKSRAGHSSNAHSSISMSSSTKGVQSRTRLVDCNLGWRGPLISDSELTKLGSEAELLRVSHPRTPHLALLYPAMPCHDNKALSLLTMLCPIMPYNVLYVALNPHKPPTTPTYHYSAGRPTRCLHL